MRGLALLLLMLALDAAAAPRVLMTSGTVAGGAGITRIDGIMARGNGFVFRGVDSRLTIADVRLATGDALPAPLRGTIEGIVAGAGAAGGAAVTVTANGPDVAAAVLVIDGASVTPLVAIPPSARALLGDIVTNARGDVAFMKRASDEVSVVVVPRSTGQAVAISQPTGRLRTPLGFAMDESGAVAWMDSRGAVSHWDPEHGTRGVWPNPTRRASRIAGGSGVALDAIRGLAFVTRDEAIVWNPATGDYQFLTTALGDVVSRFRCDVGFTDDGLSIGAVMRRDYRPFTHLCLGPVTLPCDVSGVSGASTPAPPDEAGALFGLRRGDVRTLVRPGDVVDGASTIASVEAARTDGTSIVFIARTTDGAQVLARSRDGANTVIRSPASDRLFDARDGAVLAHPSDDAAALLLVEPDGSWRLVGTADVSVGDAALTGRGIIARGEFDATVYVANGVALEPLTEGRTGEPVDADLLVRGGGRVIVSRNTTRRTFVGELRGRHARRLATFSGDEPTRLAVGRRTLGVLAPSRTNDVVGTDVLWGLQGGRVKMAARVGDATPSGVITSIDEIGANDGVVVFFARLDGDGARGALLSVSLTRGVTR